jgi:segregation and condensation protein A
VVSTPSGADRASEAELESGGFTVQVERVFSGPMDLLLHLVREQEVEIHEIEIRTILRRFLEHLAHIEKLDIENAGDFVLMAATLMAIKARSLLPREEMDLAVELDPKDELIQRLVEYRKFRAASETLESLMLSRERLFERGYRSDDPVVEVERTLDLGDVTAWDLLGLWSRFVRETLANRPHRVATEKRPIRYYVDRLVERLRSKGRVELLALVKSESDADGDRRDRLIGSFVAVLELAKLGLVAVHQDDPRGELTIELKAQDQGELARVLSDARLDEEVLADPAAEEAARAELAAMGAAAAEERRETLAAEGGDLDHDAPDAR